MAKTVQRPTQMLCLIIGLLMVGQLGECLYLPAMPAIMYAFETTSGPVQLMLSSYLLAYGGSQFIYGPLSDYYGRRPVILSSLAIFLLGGILATWASSINILILGCFIAGLGIGSGGLMARTVARDLYQGQSLQKATAIIGVAIVFTPMIAPVFGAYLLIYFGWRSNFAVFIIAGILFAAVFYKLFEETNPAPKQNPLSFKKVMWQYRELLSHPIFMANMIPGLLNIAALMGYEVIAPFLFQGQLGLGPVNYAWVSLCPIVGFLIGSIIAGTCSNKISNFRMSLIGSIAMCLGGLTFLIPLSWSELTVLGVVIPVSLFMVGSGIVFASTMAGALMPFAHMAGVAGAMIGGAQNMGAGIMTGLLSYWEAETLMPLALMLMFLALGSLLSFIYYSYKAKGNVLIMHEQATRQ